MAPPRGGRSGFSVIWSCILPLLCFAGGLWLGSAACLSTAVAPPPPPPPPPLDASLHEAECVKAQAEAKRLTDEVHAAYAVEKARYTMSHQQDQEQAAAELAQERARSAKLVAEERARGKELQEREQQMCAETVAQQKRQASASASAAAVASSGADGGEGGDPHETAQLRAELAAARAELAAAKVAGADGSAEIDWDKEVPHEP